MELFFILTVNKYLIFPKISYLSGIKKYWIFINVKRQMQTILLQLLLIGSPKRLKESHVTNRIEQLLLLHLSKKIRIINYLLKKLQILNKIQEISTGIMKARLKLQSITTLACHNFFSVLPNKT